MYVEKHHAIKARKATIIFYIRLQLEIIKTLARDSFSRIIYCIMYELMNMKCCQL